MRSGYGVYGRDDLYLLETDLIYYGWKSGEIFLRGSPLSKILDEITFESYAKFLLGKFSKKFLSILYDEEFKGGVYEKLAILNSFNGFTHLHFTYIVLRVNGFGLFRTLDAILNMGNDFVCKAQWYYSAFKMGLKPSSCPFKLEAYMGGKLPMWMEMSRRLVYQYMKEAYPHLIDEFKSFDKRVRNLVRDDGKVCCDLYTIYFVELDGRYTLLDVLVRPKLLVAEALYRELRASRLDRVVIPPLYRGELLHSPSRDIFEEES